MFRAICLVLPCFLVFGPLKTVAQKENEGDVTGPRRPNIVIFLIDTLRADRLGVYGYERPTSPNIDALAEEGVCFTRADSAAPWTLPSVVSMMTSKYPVEHQVITDGREIRASDPVLAERLKVLGYATASFYANQYAGDASGMTRGFDHAELVTHTGGYQVRKFLDGRKRDKPFLLYIHNVEPHNPFELRVDKQYIAPFGEVDFSNRLKVLDLYIAYRAATRIPKDGGEDTSDRQADMLKELRALKADTIDTLYDASVRLADERVGEVVAALREAGDWDNTLFLLVSDHGEEMGEHGGWQHDQSVYPELVHVPFILRFPGNRFGGQRRDEPVTLVDVMPTLLDWLGDSDWTEGLSGISQIPSISGDVAARARFEREIRHTAQRVNVKKYYRPFKEGRGDVNAVMHQGPWKAIWNAELSTLELYNVLDDPGNRHNVAPEHPVLVAEFRSAVQSRFGSLAIEGFQAPGGTWELTPDQIENLKTLGYL
ncbi:MAG: sulfatase-like hydrolase/transferase [Candidatus Hydrogenedentes bacterium]|nr:sulfatase-like hydrolase/transferase [Candidatus Hydrogenedentota bacterium]